MPSSAKIITSLYERRQVEAGLRRLRAIPSEPDRLQQAQAIAAMGKQVLPAILGSLDRADGPLLAAIGAVVTWLDREEVVQALRGVTAAPQTAPQARSAAVTLLERFLGEPPDGSLRASLEEAVPAALAVLEETLARAAAGHPAALIETVQGLDHQEPDVALAVVRALRAGSPGGSVDLLRMMAQDVREEIAAAALEALGSLRQPSALWALRTLLPTCAPDLRRRAERLLRKAQLAQGPLEPLPEVAPEWRALVSPVDGLGQQIVWFLQPSLDAAHARFLNIAWSDRTGIVAATAHEQVALAWLPPRRPVGAVHDITLPGDSAGLLMLEAPFDVGRRMVVDALAHNRRTQIPVAGTLRLLSPWLWGSAGADSLPPRAVPALTPADGALLALSDRLLAHPAFATWTTRIDDTLHAAAGAVQRPGWDAEVWVRRLVGALFARPEAVEGMSQRLLCMSEWLLLAGEEVWSRLALATSQGIVAAGAHELPFVRALARRDLDVAVHSLGVA